MSQDIPPGYKLESQLIYGKSQSHPGLFEIKFHNPKKKNAIGTPPEKLLTELVKQAEEDNDIKVILLHGGKYFSSGNDISLFIKSGDPDEKKAAAKYGVQKVMVDMLFALCFCKKPIVAVVRGAALGIAFTLLSHVTLVYVAPDVKMRTPFMESGQSPEGTSTYMFP